MDTRAFNFGKHKGQPLSQIPEGYLNWVIQEVDRPKDVELAKLEILRREMKLPEGQYPTMSAQEVDDLMDERNVKVRTWRFSSRALNSISKLLIREFITRPDKEMGIVSWAHTVVTSNKKLEEVGSYTILNDTYVVDYVIHKSIILVKDIRCFQE